MYSSAAAYDAYRSLLSTLTGLIILVIAIDLRLFVLKANNGFLAAGYGIGWVLLKSGFALVLFSRLHLVIPPTRKIVLHMVLASVIATALGIHVPEAAAAIMLFVHPTVTSNRFHDITGYMAM